MIIRHITIRQFGALAFYEATLTSGLNLIGNRYASQILSAMQFLLCSKAHTVSSAWLSAETFFAAQVVSEAGSFTVTAVCRDGRLMLSAADSSGRDMTAAYRAMLSHCTEEDALNSFDGRDKTLPLRLCQYRNSADAPETLTNRTQHLVCTKTFRSHLLRYIKTFRSEPIHCRNDLRITLDPQGRFQAVHPKDICLSETEERLFLYLCFLNLAEFWTETERIRDLHHEKKPLMIQNFLEFLDASTELDTLLTRTLRLRRQILIAAPLSNDEDRKSKYFIKEDPYGILFQQGN